MRIPTLLPILLLAITASASAQSQWQWESFAPLGSYSTLQDVAHLGNGTLVAIGSYRQILRSTDSGRSWSQEPTEHIDPTVLAFADSLQGVIVMWDGVVLRTRDGARSWTQIERKAERYPTDVAYDRGGTIILLTRDARGFQRSVDHGETWSWRAIDTEIRYSSVAFVDDRVALVGTSDAIYRSSDAGQGWQKVMDNLDEEITDISSAPGGFVLVSTAGQLLSSTDAGLNWNDITPANADIRFGLVATTGPERLLVISADSSIGMTSIDGGATWRKFQIDAIDSRHSHNAVVLIDEATAVAVGDRSSVHRSGVRIDRWEQILKGFAGFPQDIAFNAAGRGFIVCEGGSMYESEDLGRRWYERVRPTDSSLHAITFKGNNGLAVGAGVILRTDDGGATWEHAGNVPPDVILVAVDMLDDDHAMASGAEGAIMRTSDGGREWMLLHRDSVPIDPSWQDGGVLHDIEMIDALHAIAVGDKRIMRTSDGGSSWNSDLLGMLVPRTVEFTSAANGIIGGSDFRSFFGAPALLFYTSDGGAVWDTAAQGWQRSGSEGGEHVSDLHLLDARHAIASGTGFVETIDGGRTWQKLDGSPWAGPFAMIGDSVIVGLGGRYNDEIVRGIRSVPTGVPSAPQRELAAGLRFEQNIPNPFSTSTAIRFVVPADAHTRITVQDALGREVALLADGVLKAGEHAVVWDASGAAAGIYFCVLRQNGEVLMRTMLKR